MVIDKHFKISMIKSVIRVIGFALLVKYVLIGVILLIIAESLGIAEEL